MRCKLTQATHGRWSLTVWAGEKLVYTDCCTFARDVHYCRAAIATGIPKTELLNRINAAMSAGGGEW